jgi:hypothetical protein
MSTTPISIAFERSGLSVAQLSKALGINDSWTHDLLGCEDEINTLNLRQALRLAELLDVPFLSLLPIQADAKRSSRSFQDLADCIRGFCVESQLTVEQFGDEAGWEIEEFLDSPDTALEDWNIDWLVDVCAVLGLHWPDFLPDQSSIPHDIPTSP